jgi:hypothetical protein
MSNLTLRNATEVPAEFVVAIGDHGFARPQVPPGGEAAVVTNLYQVIAATTLLDGNTYMTAPVDAPPGTGFLAEVLQTQQGVYDFALSVLAAAPGEFSFEKAAPDPVTFTISKTGMPTQRVVVTDGLTHTIPVPLDFASYSVAAVVNGVATASVVIVDPNATVTLFEGNVSGEYALVIQ